MAADLFVVVNLSTGMLTAPSGVIGLSISSVVVIENETMSVWPGFQLKGENTYKARACSILPRAPLSVAHDIWSDERSHCRS